MKKRGQAGVSIPELMIAVAVAGILGLAAITSYSVFKEKSRVSGGQWLVYNLLMRTRSEAIAQGRTVSTADLLRNPTGSDHEASSMTAWIQNESGYSGYSVSPNAVAFDGRGLTSGGVGDISVNVSVGSKSGSVLVSSGGIVKIP
jgi:prepilin-type N-terminal cleavage/methylation domain-containing protein